MQLTNSNDRYGAIAKLLHWVTAILIIGMIILGLYMTSLKFGPQQLKLFGYHKEFGLLILMIAIVRIIWRALNQSPLLPPMPAWQKFAANAVHYAFYFFMFALPITGWMMSSASGLPVSFFGLFVMPDLVSQSDPLRHLLISIHHWLAYALIAAFCAHVGAVFQHQFILKDNILRRMLPW